MDISQRTEKAPQSMATLNGKPVLYWVVLATMFTGFIAAALL